MGDFLTRYFGHSGRIGRKTMWMGFLGLLALAIVIELILSLLFGFVGGMSATTVSQGGETVMVSARPDDWRQLIMMLIVAYPLSALWFKRSHDLNKSGLLVGIYLGIAVLSYLVGIVGLGYNEVQVGGVHMVSRTWLSIGIQTIYVILALYLLITLGFIAGTKGSNLYGSDPASN